MYRVDRVGDKLVLHSRDGHDYKVEAILYSY